MIICKRCGGKVVAETDTELQKEYPYYCPECDENKYSFEVVECGWNMGSMPEPYKMVEVLMDDGNVHADMMVYGKYGNVTWRNWDDRHVTGWREIKEGGQ